MESPKSFLALMGEDAFLQPRAFSLEVRDRDEGRAKFTFDVAFSAADLVRLGDSASDPLAKAGYFRRAQELSPDDLSITEKLADALSKGGVRDDELSSLLERLLAEAKDDSERKELLLRLLALHQAQKDRQGETGAFERLLQLAQKTGEPQYVYKANLAELYRETEPEKAARLYEELLEEDKSQNALANLTVLLDLYKRLGQRDKEEKAYERLLPLLPADQAPGVWNSLIQLREASKDEDGLVQAWEGLAASLPPGQTKVDAYKHTGFLHFQKKDYAKAEAAWKAASALDPKDPSIYLNLAAAADLMGDREAFRESLEKTVPLTDDWELELRLAQAYTEDGLEDKARQMWLSLAQMEPDSKEKEAARNEARSRILESERPPEGEVSGSFEDLLYKYSWNSAEFYNLGVAHFKLKNWAKAEKAFRQALDIGGEDQTWSRDVHSYLLAVYKEMGEKGKTLDEAMLLYRGDPSQKDFRDLAAIELEAAKNWAGLEAAAGEWVKLKKEDPDNWRYLALAQKNLGKTPEMAESLFSAANQEPNSAASWLAAGEALEQAGDIPRAKTAFEKVIELDEQNDKATQALLRFTLAELSSSKKAAGD
jgi:tetratricopeptide (TPR) repeat protein